MTAYNRKINYYKNIIMLTSKYYVININISYIKILTSILNFKKIKAYKNASQTIQSQINIIKRNFLLVSCVTSCNLNKLSFEYLTLFKKKIKILKRSRMQKVYY